MGARGYYWTLARLPLPIQARCLKLGSMSALSCRRQLTNGLQEHSHKLLPVEVRVVYLSLSIELLVERLMPKKNQSNSEMLKGTLDMMILRTLIGGDAHGHTIAKVIERTSEDLLEVEQGSLYPALHRLEDRRWA